MRVLHVIDRVLVALALGELDVEVDAGGGRTGAEEPAGSIRTNLCQQLVEGHKLARSLAHADVDAVPHEAHPRHQQPGDRICIETECLRRCPVARHGAVMVLAPQIDQLVEAP